MIMVRNDKLALIDTVTLLGERSCGIDRQQTITYGADPGAGKPYAPIRVTVTDTASAIEEECADLNPAALGTREFRTSYVWNAPQGRYLPDSDALVRLEKDNESRF